MHRTRTLGSPLCFFQIPDLYSAGIDCAMLYRAVYTITLGGSCSAGVVNSGRGAANAACASFQA